MCIGPTQSNRIACFYFLPKSIVIRNVCISESHCTVFPSIIQVRDLLKLKSLIICSEHIYSKANILKCLVKKIHAFFSEQMAQIFTRIGQVGFGLAIAGAVANSALYNVEGGHRAVIFDRVSGVNDIVVGEGTHFMIPWIQKPYIFDIRARPKNVPSITGSKDLQNVNITLRILFRPR